MVPRNSSTIEPWYHGNYQAIIAPWYYGNMRAWFRGLVGPYDVRMMVKIIRVLRHNGAMASWYLPWHHYDMPLSWHGVIVLWRPMIIQTLLEHIVRSRQIQSNAFHRPVMK